MKDHRRVDQLTVEELESVLRTRRHREQLRRLGGMTRLETPLDSGERHNRRSVRWRWIWERVLLFVEIVMLCGFFLVVAQLFLTIQSVNERSLSAFATPTSELTPVIGGVVLPGGYTPPDALWRSKSAPIPAHLQGLVEPITPLPVPTQGPEQAQRVVIPAIDVDAPVVEGDDEEALTKGAGHHIGSANPGERGNCVISAHNDIYGEIFRELPALEAGDEVFVHTQTQCYRYVVEQKHIISHGDVSVMASTSSPILTLISCYPYRVDTHLIVVMASLSP